MTDNESRTFDIIDQAVRGWPVNDAAGQATYALLDAGLLTPDLPEANDPTASFVPDGKGWLLDGPTGPVVWTASGGLVMVQRIEPGELAPAQARDLANILNAAAYYAEGVGSAGGNHE